METPKRYACLDCAVCHGSGIAPASTAMAVCSCVLLLYPVTSLPVLKLNAGYVHDLRAGTDTDTVRSVVV